MEKNRFTLENLVKAIEQTHGGVLNIRISTPYVELSYTEPTGQSHYLGFQEVFDEPNRNFTLIGNAFAEKVEKELLVKLGED